MLVQKSLLEPIRPESLRRPVSWVRAKPASSGNGRRRRQTRPPQFSTLHSPLSTLSTVLDVSEVVARTRSTAHDLVERASRHIVSRRECKQSERRAVRRHVSNHFDPQIGIAAVAVLEAVGFGVEIVPHRCCGRPLISPGPLDEARDLARTNAESLLPTMSRGQVMGTCISHGSNRSPCNRTSTSIRSCAMWNAMRCVRNWSRRRRRGGGTDKLSGGDGADTLRGGLGDDWLAGLAADDHFVGGAGLDRFDALLELQADARPTWQDLVDALMGGP